MGEKGRCVFLEENKELRNLQLTEIEILKYFIKICDENNLKYYACGGTALGAVRHGGFIPWDDDIDVFMPREDYDKIFSILKKGENKFCINSYLFNDFYNEPYYQLINMDIKLKLKNANKEKILYSWIDIFPLDGLPKYRLIRFFYTRFFILKRMFFHISVFDERVNQQNKERPWYEKSVIWICNRFNMQKYLKTKKIIKSCDKMLRKFSFYKSDYVCCLWGAYKLREIYPVSYFGEGEKIKFEDIKITLPQNYDSYLNSIYGDYMKLPPEDKRNRHDIEIMREGC